MPASLLGPCGELADADAGIRVDDLVLARVEADRVFAALAALNDHQRTAVTLRYRGGLTSTEVAARTGLRVGAVRTLTYRARVNLRRTLAEETAP